MALMNVLVDKRTIGSIASGGTSTYAHGLLGTPDAVHIRFIATLASTTSWIGGISALVDATNVSLQNCSHAASGDIEVCAVQFHSVIQ